MTGPGDLFGAAFPAPGVSPTVVRAGMAEPATTTETGAEGIAWDLSDLYGGPNDPALERDLEAASASAAEFRERYAGRIAELDAPTLLAAVLELERIQGTMVRAGSYAYLHFSTNTADPARGALLQRIQERGAALEAELLFFRLEWTALDDERADKLVADDALAEYRHFLRALRRYRPHLLSEPEERILTEKSVSGPAAWARLFSELLAGLRAPVDGKETPIEEALALLQKPDRDVRRGAADAITQGLGPGLRTRTFIFNALLVDKAIEDRLRRYEHWLAARNLANETPDEAVQALIDAVVARYDIPRRYYRLKAGLLGLDRLAHYDRLAPVSTAATRTTWQEAVTLVCEAYTSFSGEAGRVVSDFFERRWIDAPVRLDKQVGAYCMTRVPGVHPYVLLNFTGDRRSVLTLAHELGHGLHGSLAQERGVFNSQTPLTLAETASVFGEALVFKRLVAGEHDPDRRLDLLVGRIDDAVATVFRQIALNRFEDGVHTARREEGELSGDRLSELWIAAQEPMLGDMDLAGYETWWSYVPHYVVSPGYVYAYAYGYLFSLAIFRKWEREGKSVVEPYLELLRAGGSQPPERLAAIVGLDLTDPGLWTDGLAAIDELMGEAETLAAGRGIALRGGSRERS
ncbi:MAG: M3 family oligoendopeptidase [Actinomycetota bacterium]|nr:M3 family oligoendopeptidase [Actinomycetota bacterium]